MLSVAFAMSSLVGLTITSSADDDVIISPMLAANTQVLVLQADGRIFGWGDNSYGQLGIGNQKITLEDGSKTSGSVLGAVPFPVEITYFKTNGLTPVAVYCAQDTSYVKTSDGSLYACGDGSSGQCGQGTTSSYKTWVKMKTADDSDIKAGRVWVKYDTIYVEDLSTNNLFCCGSASQNKTGSLYLGDLTKLYPLGIAADSIKDIHMSATSVILLSNSSTDYQYGKELQTLSSENRVAPSVYAIWPNQIWVSGNLGSNCALLGSPTFSKYYTSSLYAGTNTTEPSPVAGFVNKAVNNTTVKTFNSPMYSNCCSSSSGDRYDSDIGHYYYTHNVGKPINDFFTQDNAVSELTHHATIPGDFRVRNYGYGSSDATVKVGMGQVSKTVYCINSYGRRYMYGGKLRNNTVIYAYNYDNWYTLGTDNLEQTQGVGGKSNCRVHYIPYSLCQVYKDGAYFDPYYGASKGGDGIKLTAFDFFIYTCVTINPNYTNLVWTKDRMMYIDSNNNIQSFGLSNAYDQLGGDVSTTAYVPNTKINDKTKALSSTIKKLIPANDITYVLYADSSKTIVSQGRNNKGQLGIGKDPTELASSPEANEITALTGKGVIGIQSSGEFTVALCGNGDIYTWGNNALGSCCQGEENSSVQYITEPTKVMSFIFKESAEVPNAPESITVPQYAGIGSTCTVKWSPVEDVTGYNLECKIDEDGVWDLVGTYQTNSVDINVTDEQDVYFRVNAQNEDNMVSPYTTSDKCTWTTPPASPTGITATPKRVEPGDKITVAWGAPAIGGQYVLQRSNNNGKTWNALTTTTDTMYEDTTDSFWSMVMYRVAYQPDPDSVAMSNYVKSSNIIVTQDLYPPDMIYAPSSVQAGGEITISWDSPDIVGTPLFNVYRKIDNNDYSVVSSKYGDNEFTETVDPNWYSFQYKITTTNGVEESDPVVSSTIMVTGSNSSSPSGGNGSGSSEVDIDSDTIAAIIAGIGTGTVGTMDSDGDGIAISTTQYIAQLKETIFGSGGCTVKGKYKTYEQMAKTGFEGHSEGMAIPVVYKSSKKQLYVSGYLLFNGVKYPVHWGDFEGPTYQQNLAGTVNGYVYVPKTDMTTDNPATECLLYIQDSDTPGEGGTPRMYYSEMFTVGVDMGNP